MSKQFCFQMLWPIVAVIFMFIGAGDTQEEKPRGCFPPDALVQTPNGSVAMEHLEIGTPVLVLNDEGDVVYSPVIGFILRDIHKRFAFNYLTIETEEGNLVTLTPSHLIHSTHLDGSTVMEKPENALPVFASKLNVSDYIFAISKQHNVLMPSKVVSITQKKITGAYVPLTLEGTIVVNGVLASCYAVIDDHRMAHMAMAPLRLLYHTMPSLLREKQGDMLLSWYPRMLETVGHMILDEEHFNPSSVENIIRKED